VGSIVGSGVGSIVGSGVGSVVGSIVGSGPVTQKHCFPMPGMGSLPMSRFEHAMESTPFCVISTV